MGDHQEPASMRPGMFARIDCSIRDEPDEGTRQILGFTASLATA